MVEKGEKNGKSSLKPVEKKSENKNFDFKIRDFGVFYEKLAFFRFPHFFPQEFSCGKVGKKVEKAVFLTLFPHTGTSLFPLFHLHATQGFFDGLHSLFEKEKN